MEEIIRVLTGPEFSRAEEEIRSVLGRLRAELAEKGITIEWTLGPTQGLRSPIEWGVRVWIE